MRWRGVAGSVAPCGKRCSITSAMVLVSCSHSPSGVTTTGITVAPVFFGMRHIRVSASTSWSMKGTPL